MWDLEGAIPYFTLVLVLDAPLEFARAPQGDPKLVVVTVSRRYFVMLNRLVGNQAKHLVDTRVVGRRRVYRSACSVYVLHLSATAIALSLMMAPPFGTYYADCDGVDKIVCGLPLGAF